jgi:hypothetical protein
LLLLLRKALQSGTSAGAVLFLRGEDVPVPILVPVFFTQPEQSTSLSAQPPEKVRSGVPVKTQSFLVLFSFSYPIFFFLFGTSERNLIRPGKTWIGGRSNRVPVLLFDRNICQRSERWMFSPIYCFSFCERVGQKNYFEIASTSSDPDIFWQCFECWLSRIKKIGKWMVAGTVKTWCSSNFKFNPLFCSVCLQL